MFGSIKPFYIRLPSVLAAAFIAVNVSITVLVIFYTGMSLIGNVESSPVWGSQENPMLAGDCITTAAGQLCAKSTYIPTRNCPKGLTCTPALVRDPAVAMDIKGKYRQFYSVPAGWYYQAKGGEPIRQVIDLYVGFTKVKNINEICVYPSLSSDGTDSISLATSSVLRPHEILRYCFLPQTGGS